MTVRFEENMVAPITNDLQVKGSEKVGKQGRVNKALEPTRVAFSREDEPYGEHTVSRLLHPLPRGFNLPTVRQITIRGNHVSPKDRCDDVSVITDFIA